MCHKSPGHTVNARQTGQRFVLQQRQFAVVAARQPFFDLFELRFNQMEVVQQPLGRRTDVIAGPRKGADVGVRPAQRHDVSVDTRKKWSDPSYANGGTVGFSQTAPMLLKALRTKDFGANRRLDSTMPIVQYVTQLRWSGR